MNRGASFKPHKPFDEDSQKLISEHRSNHPRFDCPGGLTPTEYLRQIALNGLQERCHASDQTLDLFDQEMSVINQREIADHLLIAWDLFNYARRTGIGIGPPRGRISSSLVCYALSMTDINPVRYGLYYFCAFQGQSGLPRMDIEVCCQRRPELVKYLQNRYGEKNVIQGRQVTHTLKETHPTAIMLKNADSIIGTYEINQSTAPLPRWVRTLEQKGLWRLHLIHYQLVTVIQTALERIPKATPMPRNPDELADPKVMKLFQNGETDGIGHFEDERLLTQYRSDPPRSLADLAFAYGMMFPSSDSVISAEEEAKKSHLNSIDWLRSILSTTRNILLFKEQAIEIISRLLSISESDAVSCFQSLRSREASNDHFELKLLAGARRLDLNETQSTQLLQRLKHGTLFDLSHALAMSYLALQAGWLKVHHARIFSDVYNEVDTAS